VKIELRLDVVRGFLPIFGATISADSAAVSTPSSGNHVLSRLEDGGGWGSWYGVLSGFVVALQKRASCGHFLKFEIDRAPMWSSDDEENYCPSEGWQTGSSLLDRIRELVRRVKVWERADD